MGAPSLNRRSIGCDRAGRHAGAEGRLPLPAACSLRAGPVAKNSWLALAHLTHFFAVRLSV
jgi:hypothetical protein